MQFKNTVLACVLTLFISTAARAGFNGQTLTADWYVPDNVTIIETHSFVVGPSVELPFGSLTNGAIVQIDASDSEIRFDFSAHSIWTPVTVNGFNFSDTNNTIDPIINVKLGPMSGGITGLSLSDITFNTESFFVNLQGVDAPGAGDFFTFEVTFGENTPEPSSAMLGAIGVYSLWRRRSRRKSRHA